MTKQDAQDLLDSMLTPSDATKKKSTKSNALSEHESEQLLQIVMDYKEDDKNYDYKADLAKVAHIMHRFNNQAKLVNGKKIPMHPQEMPFLVKQVLFFIAFSCVKDQYKGEDKKQKPLATQQEIIDILRGYGVIISNNFFSRMKVTPIQYAKHKYFLQPVMPINYQGQKHNELGVAVQNLVYQAGKYDVFVDVFGGSGAASVAVPRNKDADYVYNEKNISVYNLFKVMTDKKLYKDLIIELERLQSCLRGDSPDIYTVNFDQCINQYFTRPNKKNASAEFIIINENPLEWFAGYQDIVAFMKRLELYLQNQDPQSILKLNNGKVDSVQNILIKIYPSNKNLYMSFLENYKLISTILNENKVILWIFDDLEGVYYNDKKIKLNLKQKAFTQYAFYKYYAYYETLSLNNSNRVTYAVGEIFRRSLVTHGAVGISAILLMPSPQIKNGKSKAWKKFLQKDFRSDIEEIHKILRGTLCKNLDFKDVFKMYKVGGTEKRHKAYNTPLFYTDSPYLGTVGYAKKKHGVSGFGKTEMKALLNELKNSGGKFIFSCRALKATKEPPKDVIDPHFTALLDSDLLLYTTVYEFFLKEYCDKGKEIYVLAIEKGGSLKELIEKSQIAEIMITNYRIHSFSNEKYKNVSFKVYKFEELYEMIAMKYWKGEIIP